jgi:hypothetical protein
MVRPVEFFQSVTDGIVHVSDYQTVRILTEIVSGKSLLIFSFPDAIAFFKITPRTIRVCALLSYFRHK